DRRPVGRPAIDHRHGHLRLGTDDAQLLNHRVHLDVGIKEPDMRTHNSQAGFSLLELLAATALGLVVIGTAMTTFKDALGMTNVATNLADASQNLRGGTNLLVRDLTEAGRGIPTGGIPIPSGAGAGPINRPSPAGMAYTFDNINATTLTAVVTGAARGPTI